MSDKQEWKKRARNLIFWMPRIQDFKMQNFIQWAMAGFAIFISLIDFLAFSGMDIRPFEAKIPSAILFILGLITGECEVLCQTF
jgi:hypothetical protein